MIAGARSDRGRTMRQHEGGVCPTDAGSEESCRGDISAGFRGLCRSLATHHSEVQVVIQTACHLDNAQIRALDLGPKMPLKLGVHKNFM